jgi:hypothetical protein
MVAIREIVTRLVPYEGLSPRRTASCCSCCARRAKWSVSIRMVDLPRCASPRPGKLGISGRAKDRQLKCLAAMEGGSSVLQFPPIWDSPFGSPGSVVSRILGAGPCPTRDSRDRLLPGIPARAARAFRVFRRLHGRVVHLVLQLQHRGHCGL